jgi:hypothetical protein
MRCRVAAGAASLPGVNYASNRGPSYAKLNVSERVHSQHKVCLLSTVISFLFGSFPGGGFR